MKKNDKLKLEKIGCDALNFVKEIDDLKLCEILVTQKDIIAPQYFHLKNIIKLRYALIELHFDLCNEGFMNFVNCLENVEYGYYSLKRVIEPYPKGSVIGELVTKYIDFLKESYKFIAKLFYRVDLEDKDRQLLTKGIGEVCLNPKKKMLFEEEDLI